MRVDFARALEGALELAKSDFPIETLKGGKSGALAAAFY
jgi:hypothetical protein